MHDFREKIDGLEDDVLSTEGSKVVGGDSNARVLEFTRAMRHTDTRVEYLFSPKIYWMKIV